MCPTLLMFSDTDGAASNIGHSGEWIVCNVDYKGLIEVNSWLLLAVKVCNKVPITWEVRIP